MRALAGLALVAFAACQSSARHELPSGASKALATAASASPADELDRLDERRPVPLLPMMAHHQKQNMREHLVVVRELVAFTAQRDFAKVAVAAQRIGSSPSMAQMCQHMGAGSPGFTEQALAFHHAADRIADAAKQEDSVAVLTALSDTLSTCTACHAAYKQKVVNRLAD